MRFAALFFFAVAFVTTNAQAEIAGPVPPVKLTPPRAANAAVALKADAPKLVPVHGQSMQFFPLTERNRFRGARQAVRPPSKMAETLPALDANAAKKGALTQQQAQQVLSIYHAAD